MLALSQATGPSVVRLRIEGLTAKAIADLILQVLEECGDELARGVAASVDSRAIRLHGLPIGRAQQA